MSGSTSFGRRPLGDARLVREQGEAGAIRGRVLLIPKDRARSQPRGSEARCPNSARVARSKERHVALHDIGVGLHYQSSRQVQLIDHLRTKL